MLRDRYDTNCNSQQNKAAPAASAAPAQNTFKFKGHPQPSVDERLQQSRNFLADEDVNRCLDFTSKLFEIDALLNHIENENLPRNRYLFGDVKAMVDVQKDWLKWMDKHPADHAGPNMPSIPKYSTRLINADTAIGLQRHREAYGLVAQMRDDHAPFTIERSSDQVEFLAKMVQDSRTDPEEVDQATNLLFVEHRAYHWALREPSLVPYWMHWSKGLPNKGTKSSDPEPWYRESCKLGPSARVPRTPSPRPHNILFREVLPNYLQRREDQINRLLKPHQSNTVSSRLTDLLNFHAPRSLQELRDQFNHLSSIEDLLSAEQRVTLSTITSDLDKQVKEWVETLRLSGVQIRLSHTNWTDPATPGIFYVADGQPTPLEHARLQARARRINSVLASSNPSSEEQERCLNDLEDFLPLEIRRCNERIQAILIKAGNMTLKTFNGLSQTLRNEFNKTQTDALKYTMRQSYTNTIAQRSSIFGSWVATLRTFAPITLRFLRPGEIAPTVPGQLCLPWSPLVESPLKLPPPEVRQLESDINDCLYTIETDKNNTSAKARLDPMLKHVIYLHLQELNPAYKDPEDGGDRRMTPPYSKNPEECAPHPPFGKSARSFNNAYQLWKNCLLSRKVEIRIPQNGPVLDFNPGVLYYRGIDEGLNHAVIHMDNIDQWAAKIDVARLGCGPSSVTRGEDLNIKEKEMYDLLAHLQYPALRQIDAAWQTLAAMPSPDENTIREFKRSWARGFRRWLAMLLHHQGPIVIKVANKGDETLGDPGVVYYRGEIKEADSQVDLDGEILLPAYIQKQVDQINALMRKYNKGKTKKSQDELESLLRDFWRPARDHEDRQELLKDQGLVFDEIEEIRGREVEFNRRLRLFIEHSASAGCSVKKDGSGRYEVEDPTEKLPELWRIRKDDQLLGHNPLYLWKLLDYLWVFPKRFYRSLQDVEVEINGTLRALSSTRPLTDEENARLLQLMRPFLPFAIADLARQLESAAPNRSPMYGVFGQQHIPTQKSFIAVYSQWLRELQRYARTKWLKIIVWDQYEVSSGSFMGLEGRLYFPRPRDFPAQFISLSDSSPDSLPIRFQRYQSEINYLLKRRSLQPQSPDQSSLSWKENDRLRQLLHLVMNPVTAKADDELREIDEASREDILQGEELTSYLSKLEMWQEMYNKWVDSFPNGGIELRPLEQDTPRNNDNPGIRYIHVGKDQLLPPHFRSHKVPLHVQRMTREFNTALRAPKLTNLEQKAIFSQYLPLIRATYRGDIDTLREYFFVQQFPDKVNPNSKAPPNSEMVAILQCVENLALKTVWERLRQIARKGRRTGTSIEIYEQLRGDLRIRLKSPESPATTEDEGNATQMQRPILKISGIKIPGLDEARTQFVPLAEKVRNGHNLMDSERADIARHFQQASDSDQIAETEEAIVLVLKVFDGTQLTDVEELHARELMLKFLWQHFADTSADLVQRACPKLRSVLSVETLLDQATHSAVQSTPPLSPAATEAEVKEVGTEINNLLQKSRDGAISDHEDHLLDYLLRPLGNARLRELDRQIERLTLLSKSTDDSTIPPYRDHGLNARQSIHLVELQSQWWREFEKWKTNLPRYGVIIDEWFSEPDVIHNVMRRYRSVREALRHSQVHDPKIKDPLQIFLILKTYITDSSFSDSDGKLLLQRIPPDIAALRDVLFESRRTLEARNQRLNLSESLSLNLLEHTFVSRYMAWYNAVPVRMLTLNVYKDMSD